MKIVFFGSDDFATVHLQALMDSGHEVVGCVTQPDRRKNRGMKVVVSPVKTCAQEYGAPVLQPTDLKDVEFCQELKEMSADIFVVIAYGRFLPTEVLKIPEIAAINLHPSLLPKYRGAAPINWAIINGDVTTGISIIAINMRMDAGDILAQIKMEIDPQDTSVTLRKKMMRVGAELLLNTVNKMEKDFSCVGASVQDTDAVTLAFKLTKEQGHIDWQRSAVEIHNLVRGLLPWPTAFTFYNGKQLKILESCVVVQSFSEKVSSGEIVEVSKQGLIVSTGMKRKYLLIKKVHFANSKPMDAYSFAIGHKIEKGIKF